MRGVSGLGGTLSEYEITPEGGLRVRVHEREWRDDPEWFGGGAMAAIGEDDAASVVEVTVEDLRSGEEADQPSVESKSIAA